MNGDDARWIAKGFRNEMGIQDFLSRSRQEDLLREAATLRRALEAESAATQMGLLAGLRRFWRRPVASHNGVAAPLGARG
jgi:hypothetical protein